MREVANFTLVSRGLAQVGNPLTQEERSKLQAYVNQLDSSAHLTPEEARDFRRLAEEEARAHPKDDWARDLLKLAFFAFAIYALAQVLKPKDDT